MHKYVESLRALKVFKCDETGMVKGANYAAPCAVLGFVLGSGFSYLSGYNFFGSAATSAICAAIAAAIGGCLDGREDAKDIAVWLISNRNNLDHRFVKRMTRMEPWNNLHFPPAEIETMAREIVANNLYGGLPNKYISHLIPPVVNQKIQENLQRQRAETPANLVHRVG